MTTFVRDVTATQRRAAVKYLAGLRPSHASVAKVTTALGFQASVLLDHTGRLIQVVPPRPDLIGEDLTKTYDHLRRASEGQVTLSGVVPSAAEGISVTGFAVPFDTQSGRRVFSGALTVDATPLGEYLADLTPISNADVYLVDTAFNTVSSDGQTETHPSLLHDRDPALESATTCGRRGRYESGGRWEWFVSVPVHGTPWHLIVAAPESSILAPLSGAATWIPWLVFVALVSAAIGVAILLLRLATARAAQLRETERLSLTDSLTGLLNRRGFDFLGEQMLRSASRAGQRVDVLFLDLDGLKEINDRFGHDAGDQVLSAFGAILGGTFRGSDIVARLGGDEFGVLTLAMGADPSPIRARLDEQVRSHNAGSEVGLKLAFSLGASWFDPAQPRSLTDLLEDADEEMYRDKRDHKPTIAHSGIGS
ncbi:MAG: GGDEF domain-containing protein [Actinobacteria bacterium]|nr:GGDEF domain-containing protein [Actinomycetota bacterium]